MKQKLIHFLPFVLGILLAGLISCAEDEALLEVDPTYTGLLPVEKYSSQNLGISEYIANRYLNISEEENRMIYLADSMSLMEINPVYLPEGAGYQPGSYNIGWPVATMVNSSIIVSTQRKLLPGQVDDKSGKGQLLIRSDDRGNTWKNVTEVQFIQPYGYTVGSKSCIGSFDGKIIQKGSGTLISENNGQNWNPYPRAFKFASQEAYGANGPKIHNHPEFGLIFFTGTASDIDTGSVFRSVDGTTWEDVNWSTDDMDGLDCPAPSALVLNDGSILMVSSDGNNMVQYLYEYSDGDEYSDIQFTGKTIEDINTALSSFDVPDLILNPVTERIEMLESNPTALLLWSIDPDDLIAGGSDWELETILMNRNGISSMHPAGTVVDVSENLQHIFLYMGGLYPDRNSIFRLSRTLDTESISDWINNYRSD